MTDSRSPYANDERALQIKHARSLMSSSEGNQVSGNVARRSSEGSKQEGRANKPQAASSGHQHFLKMIQTSGNLLRIVVASTGEIVEGMIKATDKYTISLKCSMKKVDDPQAYQTRVFFKHDISEFSPVIPSLHKSHKE